MWERRASSSLVLSHQIHEPNRNEDQNWKEQHTQIGFLQHKRVADIGDTIQGHKLQKRQEGPAEAVVILFHQNTKGWMCSKVRVFGYQPKSVQRQDSGKHQLRPCVQKHGVVTTFFWVATRSNFPRAQLSCGISGSLPRLSTATQAHMNRLMPMSIVIDNMVCPAFSRPYTKRHTTLKWLIILPRLTSQIHETLHVQTLPWYNNFRKQRCAASCFACLSFLLISLFFEEIYFFLEIWNLNQATPQNRKNQRILRNVWVKNFLCRHCFICCFWCSSIFFGFWFRKPLSATRTTKNPKTEENLKTKKTKDSQECLGQGLCSEALFFFFWFSSSVFGFWLRKLLTATRTTKNPKTSRKTKKTGKKTQYSQECLGPFLQMQWFLFVFLIFCVLWSSCFCFLVLVVAPPPENNAILLQTLSPINLSSIGFLLCSILRVAVAKKTTNQGHEG